MTKNLLLIFVATLMLVPVGASADDTTQADRVDRVLEEYGVANSEAALLIVRLEDGREWRSAGPRIDQQFPPASTAKIPHTLIALETGYADGPELFFKWDGQARFINEWNRDQTLASAYRFSVVWVYQQITRDLGFDVMSEWIKDLDYGNAYIGNKADLASYWLIGPLETSAHEQVEFLTRLVRGELPISAATLRMGKEIMRTDAGEHWSLYSKTGWFQDAVNGDIGWYVGWVENAVTGSYVFALNLNLDEESDLAKRQSIVLTALKDIGALSN